MKLTTIEGRRSVCAKYRNESNVLRLHFHALWQDWQRYLIKIIRYRYRFF